MAEKLNPFYKLLKAEAPINITSEQQKKTFLSVNKALSDAWELTLKQPIPYKQLVFLADVKFGSTGFAMMIEENPDLKLQSKQKLGSVESKSRIFSPAQLKKSIYSKDFLVISFTQKQFP